MPFQFTMKSACWPNTFTHSSTLSALEVLTAIINVPDQTPPGVLANLDLYCTDLIDRAVVIH